MPYHFEYVSRKDPRVRTAYDDLMLLLNEVGKELKPYYTFQHKIVGSYARNMITYDVKSNRGFDFDVNVYPIDDQQFTPKQIKLLFKDALDKHVIDHGFDFAEDSTRVLTIKIKDIKHSSIVFSIDFAFVRDYMDDDGDKHQEYIHLNKKQNSYTWNDQPEKYYQLLDKIDWIKQEKHWGALRLRYLEKKNRNTDPDVHSRSIFASAVHEICQKYGYYDEEEEEQNQEQSHCWYTIW